MSKENYYYVRATKVVSQEKNPKGKVEGIVHKESFHENSSDLIIVYTLDSALSTTKEAIGIASKDDITILDITDFNGDGTKTLKRAPSGKQASYYSIWISNPRNEQSEPYLGECEDIITALEMSWSEANIFKEIWRTASARLGNGKPDHTPLYGAEKIEYYAKSKMRNVKNKVGIDGKTD